MWIIRLAKGKKNQFQQEIFSAKSYKKIPLKLQKADRALNRLDRK